MAKARRAALSIALIAVISVGCVQEAQPPPAPTDLRAQTILDSLIFDPSATCDQLAQRFDVTDLPMVETPDQLGIAYEESYIPTFDGVMLRTWYMPAPRDRGLVVLVMGAAGRMNCYMYTAIQLVSKGWSVVMYDFRGMGGSSGAVSAIALGDDLNTVVEWALQRTRRAQVTLMGISLGTIPIVEVAVRRPNVVNGVILDSPVALDDEIARFGRLVPGLTWISDYLPDGLFADRIIGGLTQPSLFFANEADHLTPERTVQRLFDEAGGDKSLVSFPGIGHARGIFLYTASYVVNVDDFLTRVWPYSEIVIGAETPSAAGD